MTLDEKYAILGEASALKKAGDRDGFDRLMKTVPIPSYHAKFLKEKVGVEYLLNSGWNLSEAEAEFGSDWLSR
jgi:hypothetical protein